MFYRDSQIAFVCYDDQNGDSVSNWVERVHSEVPECLIFLVSTKSDTYTEEEIQAIKTKGEELKETYEAHGHYITSAKERKGVTELFEAAAKCSSLIYQSNQPTVDIGSTEQTGKKDGCC